MKKNNPYRTRLIVLLCVFAAVLCLFGILLVHYQIVEGDSYRALSAAGTAKREVVETSRGIITDRNGKVLVSNRLTYTLKFSAESFADDAACNAAVWRLLELCTQEGLTWIDPLPLGRDEPYGLTDPEPGEAFTTWMDDYKIAYSGEEQITLSLSGDEMMAKLRKIYTISSDYTDQQARLIAGVRYGAEVSGGYVFAEDVPVRVISQVVDGHFAGVSTGTSSQRVYNTTYAAHILGRVSRIFAEDWNEKYKDNSDYSMDDLVGKGGVEEAFEQYLHGVNGVKLVTTDKNGKVTGELYAKEPQPGNTVALTIDIDLQKVAEDSLAATIQSMTGRDGVARGGAAAVIGVGTGDVLALASYPTYDLNRWDEMYDSWSKDPALPMFNRATDGTYATGSTFKLCTSVAGLESGVITPSTTIVDRGIYTYYEFPQPKCWIYNATGGTHGAVNVSKAITVSCNYFFYEVGYRLGSKNNTTELNDSTGLALLAKYAKMFGLDSVSGLELPETTPRISDESVVRSAIGQATHNYTAAELARYVTAIANSGNLYQLSILDKITDSEGNVLEENEPKLTNKIELKQSTWDMVHTGMYKVCNESSYRSQMGGLKVTLAGKSGTAQVSEKLPNHGLFIGYAPYENPEVAATLIIPNGHGSSNVLDLYADLMCYYFGVPEKNASDDISGSATRTANIPDQNIQAD